MDEVEFFRAILKGAADADPAARARARERLIEHIADQESQGRPDADGAREVLPRSVSDPVEAAPERLRLATIGGETVLDEIVRTTITDSHHGEYWTRRAVRPVAGDESEVWPDIEDLRRIRQLLSQRAYEAGYNGADADGAPLRLARMVEHSVESRVAAARMAARASVESLMRTIAVAPEWASEAIAQADDRDRATANYLAYAKELRVAREHVSLQYANLSSAERGGQIEGKSGVLAVMSLSMLDASMFVIMSASLRGSIGLRVLIAVALTAAFTVVVAGAGRLIAELWSGLANNSARARAVAVRNYSQGHSTTPRSVAPPRRPVPHRCHRSQPVRESGLSRAAAGRTHDHRDMRHWCVSRGKRGQATAEG